MNSQLSNQPRSAQPAVSITTALIQSMSIMGKILGTWVASIVVHSFTNDAEHGNLPAGFVRVGSPLAAGPGRKAMDIRSKEAMNSFHN